MVIGGAEIYSLCLPLAERLYPTEVHGEPEGDVWFPRWDQSLWRECEREHHSASDANPFDYSFVVYERR
jgi:dihydrofolate reductase